MRASNIIIDMNEVHLTSKLTFSLIDDDGNHIENVEMGGIHTSLPRNPDAESISHIIEQHIRSREVAIKARAQAVEEFKALSEAIRAIVPKSVTKTSAPAGYVSLESNKVEVGKSIKGSSDSDNICLLRDDVVVSSVSVATDGTFTVIVPDTPVILQVAKANRFMDVSADKVELAIIDKIVTIEPVIVIADPVLETPVVDPVLDVAAAVLDEV